MKTAVSAMTKSRRIIPPKIIERTSRCCRFQSVHCQTAGCKLFSVRGTSGDLRHPRQSRYRCSLPGLAGFAGPRCTEPEVPRSGSRAHRPAAEKSLAHSVSVEMRREVLGRNVAERLSIDSNQGSTIQFAVIRYREGCRVPSEITLRSLM